MASMSYTNEEAFRICDMDGKKSSQDTNKHSSGILDFFFKCVFETLLLKQVVCVM